MITLLSFLVVLTILVMAHEVGHLVAAKRLGIKVETFAIGFGPRVVGLRLGDTDYVLRLVPLGGYVQLGETGPSDIFCPGSPHYAERPPFDKIIVALSGPLASILLAILVLSLVSLLGMSAPAYMHQPAAVGWVAPASPAEKAGLRAGDVVVGVNGTPAATWQEVTRLMPLHDKNMRIELTRAGRTQYAMLSRANRLNAGLFPVEPITVGAVAKGSPAQEAGLQTGDVILTAGGRPLAAWGEFQHAVAGAKVPLLIGVERMGKIFSINITPEMDRKTGKALAGISYSPQMETTTYSSLAAIKNGLVTTGATVSDSIDTFRGLLTGSLSLKMLGGPIAIARASGDTARNGLVALLSFLAFLSVQLGIVNLLPFVPVVDGGQITIFLFEMVRRRPMGRVPLEWLLKAGWAAMGALILVVTYNDVMNLL
jgi:regulator of sigma E protease